MARDKNIFKENMTFDYTELTALCEHLKIREREGKRLKGIDKHNLTYDICEPRDMRYSAVIFNIDLMHKDFIASCEHEGWEYVTSHNELCIFRTKNPDATEIMTDEKDYFKIITKRFLLHPRFFGFSFATIYAFLQISQNMKNIDLKFFAPYTTDIVFILCLFMLIFALIVIFIKTFEYIEWYLKAKKAVRKGEKIPFLNFEERRNKLIAREIIYGIWLIALYSLFAYTFLGYLAETDILYTIALIPCLLSAFAIYDKRKKIGKLKTLVLSVLSIAIIMSGTYGLAIKFDTEYKENTKIIKMETIPFTVTHFGCKEEIKQENEISEYEGTRFAQFYSIDSKCTECGKYIHYTVFVSNYPLMRKNFIEALKKENERASIYQKENNQWSELYQVINERDFPDNYGFAIKGNTIIYLSYHTSDVDTLDFFDTAYNKFFG